MNHPLMRTVIGCAMACGAFVVGPASVGAAAANADLLGIGGGAGVDILGIDVSGGGAAKKGSGPSGSAARVNTVSTAPSARTVVVRSESPATQPNPTVMPAAYDVPMAEAPAVALGASYVESAPVAPPPAAPPPAAPPLPMTIPLSVAPAAPVVRPPAPEGVPISTTNQPAPSRRIGPAEGFSPPAKIPNSFRVGHDAYLRSATTGDMLAAALPGVAGIAGFAILGAYAGYRQAKDLQKALVAPVPTSFLL